jgi:hypothetical protein
MANRSSNRSAKLKNEADVRYEIDTPFTGHDAKILLIERGENEVEIIVGDIPEPAGYNLDKNHPDLLEDEESLRYHAVAEWIVDETTRMFSEYDWETSEYKTNNPNYHLRDIYFTCSKNELDQAVMTAKKFITELEEKTLMHAKKFDRPYHSPSDDL